MSKYDQFLRSKIVTAPVSGFVVAEDEKLETISLFDLVEGL